MEGVPSVRDSLVRARILVRGVVQGVFFRASMREEALRLGLSGWVRNLPDGESVEAVVEGRGDAVERIICWCLRGPPAARVRELRVELEPYKGEFRGFEIRY
ncbi:putative acylphosphatase [Aeropyrum pernix K1]|uniref:Acylphosphatase n=1 Tax=Aeropyrum pernix (strain ATCC 700893 / DSM 11879 / JCM 9820 / NBRC 100138 / K1) TaxID=272557 RepID=ACYP_AERPE|nr:acylphosphatase [Aeropyrum pernix]Q9YBK7.2 RecName: Full=Acylphosphatase; AltName: Full=Acylphosphate phosphohydrolase [Aeropyrum pernix K1]BAA80591.2 putative acylphosphatase [Aeropyrum pernix K1]